MESEHKVIELSFKDFRNQKKQVLGAVDSSRKGSIDEPIREIIQFLNDFDDYVTTSSCSGRISLINQNVAVCGNRKQKCQIIYSSHDQIEPGILVEQINSHCGNLELKVDPFILHVQCRTLKAAVDMMRYAKESGYRNSGMTIGNNGKIMVAVRGTSELAVPFPENGNLLVTNEYLRFLAEEANTKLAENERRVDLFKKIIMKSINRTE